MMLGVAFAPQWPIRQCHGLCPAELERQCCKVSGSSCSISCSITVAWEFRIHPRPMCSERQQQLLTELAHSKLSPQTLADFNTLALRLSGLPLRGDAWPFVSFLCHKMEPWHLPIASLKKKFIDKTLVPAPTQWCLSLTPLMKVDCPCIEVCYTQKHGVLQSEM